MNSTGGKLSIIPILFVHLGALRSKRKQTPKVFLWHPETSVTHTDICSIRPNVLSTGRKTVIFHHLALIITKMLMLFQIRCNKLRA